MISISFFLSNKYRTAITENDEIHWDKIPLMVSWSCHEQNGLPKLKEIFERSLFTCDKMGSRIFSLHCLWRYIKIPISSSLKDFIISSGTFMIKLNFFITWSNKRQASIPTGWRRRLWLAKWLHSSLLGISYRIWYCIFDCVSSVTSLNF